MAAAGGLVTSMAEGFAQLNLRVSAGMRADLEGTV
jgi:hypothetical protein